MNNMLRYILALPMFAALSACIAFPNKSGDPEPFGRKNVAFIEVGKTTKNEIEAEMPSPMKSPQGDSWLYAKSREELGWDVVVFTPSTGPEVGQMGTTDYRYLRIRFDEHDVVAAVEASRSEEPTGCNRSAVCVLEGTYMIAAPEEQNRTAKHFNVSRSRCAVYVYGNPKTPIHISFDGARVGALFGEQGFILQQLDPGVRKLEAIGPKTSNYKHKEFSCYYGGLVFFQITTMRHGVLFGQIKVEVTQLETPEGRQAVDERGLTLRVTR